MVHESRLESVDVTLHSPRSRWNKKIVHVDMYVQFPCLLESGLSSLVGNDFNEKNLKSELTIVILISNKNFLNHDSPEINRLIMLHVTKKCWRPFRHWQRQTWEEGVRNSRWAKAFLKMAGLFWLLYHKKKSFVSWNKWILELGTSNFHQPLSGNCQQQHRRGRFISSLDSQRDRWCMS